MDFSITNWNVTVDSITEDIRELIRAGVEITDDQIDELYDNNGNLLTYSDLGKLADFKDAFRDASEQFSSAVNALEALGESGRRARYRNAFNLDSELDLWIAKGIVEYTIPSISEAFVNAGADIVGVEDEETDEKIIVHEDGYAYWQSTSTIFLEYSEPVEGNITICDLVNGDKSPRDVLDDATTAHDADEDYEPYKVYKTETYKENVTDTEWDDPIDTYTVPLAAITIDGIAGDWGSVSTFYDDGDTNVKIARDAEGNFYLYVSKPEGFDVKENEYNDYGYYLSKWMPGDWENYFGVDLSFSWDYQGDFYLGAGEYDSSGWNDVDDVETIKSDNTVIGAEVKYPKPAFDRLVESGSMNNFGWWSWPADDHHWELIKLLPEAGQ